jgi:hypothetical protein
MPNKRGIFSSAEELREIATILKNYMRLPFTSINIPGAVMEGVLGHVRKAEVLRTYDFIDVLDSTNGVGWQIKSTLAQTPVTWKRAKIPNSLELIAGSEKAGPGCQALGDAIIEFCNAHGRESLKMYKLREIGYARLILHSDGDGTYFERSLCSRSKPNIFNPKDFTWKWSTPKVTVAKEQLTALHGTHVPSGKKWWAWHGRGENQLHFSGERAWWPEPSSKSHSISLSLPGEDDRLSIEAFINLLAVSSNPLPKP